MFVFYSLLRVSELVKKGYGFGKVADACYDRGSTFRLNWFLNGGAPLTQTRRKYDIFFSRDFRRVPRSWDFSSDGSFMFLQFCFWESFLKLPKLRNPRKNVVHLYRSTCRGEMAVTRG